MKRDIKKRDIIEEDIDNPILDDEENKKEKIRNKIDGIKYLDTYMPRMKPTGVNQINHTPFHDELKVI